MIGSGAGMLLSACGLGGHFRIQRVFGIKKALP